MGVSLPGGGGGGRGKSQNFDLNLVPFIDLLSVLITFLLVTAVWLR
jgi:biopolymer transport protein TolR